MKITKDYSNGNIIRTKNILEYFGKKICESELERDEKELEKLKDDITNKMIPKNEINNKNIGMLLSPKFENQLFRESMGGNAGEMHAGVNAHYNPLGEITRFSNYPQDKKNGEKEVTFHVDMGYLSYPRNIIEKVLYKLQKRKDRWLIDGVYFEDKNENEDVKSVIENPANYVNKLSKKERRDYKKWKIE